MCACEHPQEFTTPNSKGFCAKCGLRILTDREMDGELSAFLVRLAESQYAYGPDGELATPEWWDHLHDHALIREMAGRERFQQRYLYRDNAREALEEACDGVLYMMLDLLRAKREGNSANYDDDVALTAAYHFAQAHRFSRMLIAKRRGDTGPGMED